MPCAIQIFPVLYLNALCFPCLEKFITKFPVFPVLWPPRTSILSNVDHLTCFWLLVAWPWLPRNFRPFEICVKIPVLANRTCALATRFCAMVA